MSNAVDSSAGESLILSNGRAVTHLMVTHNGSVHYAQVSRYPGMNVTGCTGRTMDSFGDSLENASTVTCKSCRRLA
jgi:hypothetical protein